MAKLRLVCLRNMTEAVTSSLHDAGALHIEHVPFDGDHHNFRRRAMDAPTRDDKARLERLREQLTHLHTLLPAKIVGTPLDGAYIVTRDTDEVSSERADTAITAIEASLSPLVTRVDEIVTVLNQCEDELSLISKYGNALEAFAPFLALMRESETVEYVGLILERQESAVDTLKQLMTTLMGDQYELFQTPLDDHRLAVLAMFPTSYASKVRGLLVDEGVTDFQLPTSVADKPFGQALSIVLHKKITLPSQIQQLQEDLHRLSHQWRGQVVQWSGEVRARMEQINVRDSYYDTDMASFMYGWIPSRQLDELSARLHEDFAQKVVIEELHISKTELADVPVVLRNSGLMKSFERLTTIIDLPRYGSIDPTPFLAVFFPLFYGAILGDIGYGLILFAITGFVRQRYDDRPFMHDVVTIATTASISSVVFGVLYGEFFGSLGEPLGIHPFINRMDALLPILICSIAVGIIHVSLGIILGILTAWRQHDWKEGLAKAGALLLVLGFGALGASLADVLPPEAIPWVLGEMSFSCLLIFGAGGAHAAMKLHNIVNVVSYLRIMGIGLASAALAFTANMLSGLVGNIVLAVAIGSIFHALNLLFGILSPTIQSLRLHYVEFFENFFEPGGRPYAPFGRVRDL